MLNQNDTLKTVCAEQANTQDAFEAYADLLENIGQSASALVKTCLLAIELYHDAKAYFDNLSRDSRAIPPNKAVAIVALKMDRV